MPQRLRKNGELERRLARLEKIVRRRRPDYGGKGRKRRRVLGMSLPVFVAFLILLGTAGGSIALLINALAVQKIDIWGGNIQPTDFTVVDQNVKTKGKNRIDFYVRVQNTDSGGPHEAVVTLQLLDSGGNMLLEDNLSTGSVPALGFYEGTAVFSQADLVSQFSIPWIVIYQVS